MASQKTSRIGTLKDEEKMKAIVKSHLVMDPTTCQKRWQYRNFEEVVTNFQSFLVAVAATNCMLSKKVLAKALRARHEGDRAGLDAFAQCMVETLQSCRGKLRMVRSGAKTCDALVNVCKAWPASSEEVESSDEVDEEVESSEEEVLDVGDEPDEAEKAKQTLLKTMALFGGAPTRTLAKQDSIVSIGSSAPSSPKTGVEAKMDIKADHPLLTPCRGFRV